MCKVLLRLLRIGISALLVVAFFISNEFTNVSAQEQKTWFDLGKDPALDATWTIDSEGFGQSVPQTYKRSCTNKTIVTRPFRVSPAQSEQKISRCWHETGIGLVASQSDAYLVAPGINIAGPISNHPASATLYSTPEPNTLLDIRSGTSNNYVRFHYGAKVTTTKNANGSVAHTLSSDEIFTLKTSVGTNVSIATGQGVNFSPNGDWATGVTVNYAMFRINMKTKQILNFGEPISSGPGWNPFMRVSITNDGRYAVASGTAQEGAQWMRVYDLFDCADTDKAFVNISHANCKYRDLTDFLHNNIPNFNRFTMAEFAGKDALVFYHYNAGTPRLYTRFVLRAPNSDPESRNYLALGDSYSSGEGAFGYETGTDEENNWCHLSKFSYPYNLSREIEFDSFHSVACSGAVLANLNGKVAQYPKNPAAMPLGYWQPGMREQLAFLKENPIDIVTVGIIGNDIGFGDKIKRCVNPGTCFVSLEERHEIIQEVNDQFDKLYEFYNELREIVLKNNPNGKVFAIGYPQVAKPGGECGLNVLLNGDELDVAQNIINHLNGVIKAASKKAGVYYAGIESALYGHRLCEDTETPAMNGLTAGDNAGIKDVGPIGNESYHPTAFGYSLISEMIRRQTNDLGFTLPIPDSFAELPSVSESLLLQNAPKEGRATRKLISNEEMSEDTVSKDQHPVEVKVDGLKYGLKSSTSYELVLTSTPVSLGFRSSDENTNLNTTITLPAGVEPGFHTLHVYGKNIDGQEIDIYKTLYIAEAIDDWDGDGIANNSEVCLIVEPSNIDKDSDGIDDACDSVVTLQIKNNPVNANHQYTSSPDPINTMTSQNSSNQLLTTSYEQSYTESQSKDDSKNKSEVLATESIQPKPDINFQHSSYVYALGFVAVIVIAIILISKLYISY